MISLASEMTDSKGRHAHAWLFFDAECQFCTRIAVWLAARMRRRRLAIAPLQDPRVRSLLGLPQKEMLRTIRFVTSDGCQHSGADALVAVAGELWWAAPLVWACRLPGGMAGLRRAYQWVAERRRCQAQRSPVCMVDSTPILEEERL